MSFETAKASEMKTELLKAKEKIREQVRLNPKTKRIDLKLKNLTNIVGKFFVQSGEREEDFEFKSQGDGIHAGETASVLRNSEDYHGVANQAQILGEEVFNT